MVSGIPFPRPPSVGRSVYLAGGGGSSDFLDPTVTLSMVSQPTVAERMMAYSKPADGGLGSDGLRPEGVGQPMASVNECFVLSLTRCLHTHTHPQTSTHR